MTKARDIATLLSTANGKIAGENLDVSFENITDTGTEGTKIASGTTAQRGSTAGQLRYNSTLSRFEGSPDGFSFVGFATPPSITSISPSILDSAGGETVVITGTNFAVGATTVTLNGQSPSTTTVNSETQITITGTPALSAQTYTDGLSINASGAIATFTFSTSGTPVFTTASGSLGSINEGQSAGTLDAGTDVGTSHTISSGSLPSGLSINSADGEITGTMTSNTNTANPPENATGDITSNFTVLATDAENQTASRNFSITNLQGDPYYNNTIAIINNESTLTTNSAYTNRTVSQNGISYNTTYKKFGSNSFEAGSGDSFTVTVDSSEAINEISNICFEGWFYLSSNTGNQTYGSFQSYRNQALFGVPQVYWGVIIDPNGRVGMYEYTNQENYAGQFTTTSNVSTGTWFYATLQVTPSSYKYWKDGVYCGSVSRGSVNESTPHLYKIFTDNNDAINWIGYGEQFRITVGERYTGTGNFTVPSTPIRDFTT